LGGAAEANDARTQTKPSSLTANGVFMAVVVEGLAR
jgi:hypothetical protein